MSWLTLRRDANPLAEKQQFQSFPYGSGKAGAGSEAWMTPTHVRQAHTAHNSYFLPSSPERSISRGLIMQNLRWIYWFSSFPYSLRRMRLNEHIFSINKFRVTSLPSGWSFAGASFNVSDRL